MRYLGAILILLGLESIGQFNPEQIEIIRDEWGVPHIYAPTDAQVSYGLAWAHAEDDFKTIQEILLAAKQMMGRHLGRDGAPIDYVVGLLSCEDIVNQHLPEVDPAFIKIVQGYTAGINAYAANHKDEVLVKKAFPVTLKDVFKAYVLQLAVQDGADNLIRNLFDGKVDTIDFETKGSNAFAISRQKTTSDEVFLAINSHQPLEGPAAWYEAHLVSEEGWNMLGGLFPGGPVIFHGTNEHLGWAHTVNYFDKRDVFQLEMHPENEDLYRLDDEWLELEKRKVKLKVKVFLGLKIGVKRDAYYSKYGPVVKNSKGSFAFKMSVFNEIRAIEQWYKMNKAQNFTEFKKALSLTAIPSFNIVYADRYDSLFYVGNGKIPIRNPNYDWSTTLPGNTTETLSDGYHAFTDLPQLTNPPSGYLFNTNNGAFNATAPKDNLSVTDFDQTMGYRSFENNRSYRFMELIDQYETLSWDDFLDIKYDATLPDSLVYWIDLNPVFDLEPSLADSASQILEIIQRWDKSARADKIGPAHLNIFYKGLARISDKIDINNISTEQYIKAVDYVRRYLLRYFGKIDVTLGEYQKLVRGEDEYPIGGLPDVIAAMHADYMGEGKVRAKTGESYIMMVRYPKDGLPNIETTNVFGASNRPESPHYDDQIPLFLNRERKQMTLDIDKVRENAKRIYHPK
ncbi:penicillin acylase family protein [Ekhidna sp.]|uniref:penicillin acylase family protein n=1 Tax=Ekhidna sp. TaxID=2608089 RepID=UPI0032995916